MLRIALLTIGLALLATAPASAATAVFAAYGTGTTTCRVTVTKEEGRNLWTGGEHATNYHGNTDCDRAIQQTGQAWVPNSPLMGELCSGVRASCHSGEDLWGGVETWRDPTHYRVNLIAPHGQGWLAVPEGCSGVGSDNVTCVFTSDQIIYGWST
jgi:hypothetical protein